LEDPPPPAIMKIYHLFLAALMMTTGSINTITTKFADLTCAKGSGSSQVLNEASCNTCMGNLKPDQLNFCIKAEEKNYCNKTSRGLKPDDYELSFGPNSDAYRAKNTTTAPPSAQTCATQLTCCQPTCKNADEHIFDHPFAQAFAMFVGEFLCLLVFKLMVFTNKAAGKEMEMGPQEFSPFVWAIPAFCDCCATSTMYIGLTLTYASSFQMLRGAVVIFTGIFSVWILKRKLVGYHWAGMFVVLLGLLCVGGAVFINPSESCGGGASNQILGDALIIAAQVVVAIQMVVEEKLMTKYKTPALQAVGWEGVFGMFYMSIFCLIFYHTPGPREGDKFENAIDAWAQFTNSSGIQLAIVGTICSIALFNYSGLSVTKEMSATTRMVLDSLRTIVIWVFGLMATDPNDGTHWETFDPSGGGWMQIAGFVLLLTGSALYNEKTIPGAYDADGNLMKEPLLYPLLRVFGLSVAKLPDASHSSESSALLGKNRVN